MLWLLIIGNLCNLALAGMGFYVTIHPIHQKKDKDRFKIAFVLVGVVSIVFSIITTVRTNNETDSNFGILGKKIDTVSQKLDIPHSTETSPIQTPLPSKTAYCAVPTGDRHKIIEAFKVVGKQKISVTSTLGDSHAYQCASDWVAALKDAEWQVDGPNQSIFNRPMTGILLSIGPANGREQDKPVSLNTLPIPVAALIQIFQINHIAFQLNLDPSIKDTDSAALIFGGEP